jgi:triacylglycerol lipase
MFPKSANSFNPDACAALALAAQTAYATASEAEIICGRNGAQDFYWIEDVATDTQCFVAIAEPKVVVAFRGTTSVRDVITDAQCLRTRLHSGIEVHGGFERARQAIAPRLYRFLATLDFQPRLWFTGHSLGGALAMLCANACNGWPASAYAGVYTYGQPRVGNAAFRDTYNAFLGAITFRVVNEEDIVPRVPGYLVGFRHAGNEVFLKSPGGVALNPTLGEKITSDIAGIYSAWDKMRSPFALAEILDDHHIAAYLDRCRTEFLTGKEAYAAR